VSYITLNPTIEIDFRIELNQTLYFLFWKGGLLLRGRLEGFVGDVLLVKREMINA